MVSLCNADNMAHYELFVNASPFPFQARDGVNTDERLLDRTKDDKLVAIALPENGSEGSLEGFPEKLEVLELFLVNETDSGKRGRVMKEEQREKVVGGGGRCRLKIRRRGLSLLLLLEDGESEIHDPLCLLLLVCLLLLLLMMKLSSDGRE